MNSSDEAAEALATKLAKSPRVAGSTRRPVIALILREAWPEIAAAVRAEAVTDPDAQPCTSCEGPTGNPDTFCDACKLDELEQECDRLRAKLAEAVAGERRRITVEIAKLHSPRVVSVCMNDDEHDGEPCDCGTMLTVCAYCYDLFVNITEPYTSDHAVPESVLHPCPTIAALAAGSVLVATPEPDDSRITNLAGHEFTFTVELRGEGFNWSSTMVPQTVRAYDLPAAIAELARVPLPAWFEEESDEVADPKPTVCEFCRRADGGHERSCLTNLPESLVATPPAEPAGGLPKSMLINPSDFDFEDDDPVTVMGAPSQPVTCAHWKTESHVIDLAWPHKVWCPGPVSVPKESSE